MIENDLFCREFSQKKSNTTLFHFLVVHRFPLTTGFRFNFRSMLLVLNPTPNIQSYSNTLRLFADDYKIFFWSLPKNKKPQCLAEVFNRKLNGFIIWKLSLCKWFHWMLLLRSTMNCCNFLMIHQSF